MNFFSKLKLPNAPKLPKTLTIRMRIYLLAGLGVVGMAALTGAYLIGEAKLDSARQNEKTNAALMRLVNEVAMTAAKLRRHENDFLLTANRDHALKYQSAAADISELVQKMGDSPLSRSINEPVLELQDAVTRHAAEFVTLVELQEKIGLDRMSGLNGKMQGQFNVIDDNLIAPGLEELRAHVMMMVRYLRDFTLSHDEDNITQIEIVREKFNFALVETELTEDEKAEITKLMDGYIATISEWAETTYLRDENIKKLNAIYSEIDPALHKITTFAKAGLEKANKTLETTRTATNWIVLATSGIMFVAVMVIGLLVGRSITGPLFQLTSATTKLAGGDLECRIPWTKRDDEIGNLSRAVLVFKKNAVEKQRLEAQEAEERETKEKRAKSVELLIKNFEETSNEALQNVINVAASLEETSTTMASAAETTNQQSSTVQSGAESASSNVQTVATATEELSGSIEEISRQVTQSNTVSEQAVEESRKTRETMKGLAASAETIGDVVNLIQEIAAQTNLLALNATIEAARAGEAGKGFAVVASEVKQLANQTSKATDEIAQQIGNIQSTATSAVKAIEQVDEVIEKISGYSASVASAVEQQSAATRHIADNVQQAASGTNTVTESIGGLNEAANETTQAAQQVKLLSGNLSEEAERLKEVAQAFLENVRAA